MTENDFNIFIDQAYEEMEEKQKDLIKKFKLDKYQEFFYDQKTQTLQFKNDEKVEIEFDIIFIGSWAKSNSTWLWSWANNSNLEQVRKKSEVFKKLYEITGSELFTEEGFECDDMLAYELTSMCLHLTKALGMYKIPRKESDLFLALQKKL